MLVFSLVPFQLQGKTKHLVTGPTGNSAICFSSTLNVPNEGIGETKLTVPLGTSH